MATKKSGGSKKASAAATKGLTGASARAMSDLAAQGRPVHVIGRMKNGKLEIDQSSLEAAARNFPNANWAFVAVNAPFDPVSHA